MKLTSVEVPVSVKEWSMGTIRIAVRYCRNRRHGNMHFILHFVTNKQELTVIGGIGMLDITGCFLSWR